MFWLCRTLIYLYITRKNILNDGNVVDSTHIAPVPFFGKEFSLAANKWRSRCDRWSGMNLGFNSTAHLQQVLVTHLSIKLVNIDRTTFYILKYFIKHLHPPSMSKLWLSRISASCWSCWSTQYCLHRFHSVLTSWSVYQVTSRIIYIGLPGFAASQCEFLVIAVPCFCLGSRPNYESLYHGTIQPKFYHSN